MTTIRDDDILPFVRGALKLPAAVSVSVLPVATGGSGRSFRRVQCSGKSPVIFMHYADVPAENTYYAAIAGFLGGIGVTVPRIMIHDPTHHFLIMEDLGDKDLWSYRGAPWKERRRYYLKTLTLAARLHAFPLEAFPSQGVTLMDGFTPALYRWERDYFRENFVEGFCRLELSPQEKDALEEELNDLAGRLAAGRHCLVHRDLQSQNVMIRNGEPALIDFQGMRPGNPLYDLGSLLCDPYVTLSDTERLELLSSYHEFLQPEVAWEEFTVMFWEAAAQRLMQALGAYGYLGLKKNRPEFLAHIPAGLETLLMAAGHAGLPHLRDLARTCREAPEKKE